MNETDAFKSLNKISKTNKLWQVILMLLCMGFSAVSIFFYEYEVYPFMLFNVTVLSLVMFKKSKDTKHIEELKTAIEQQSFPSLNKHTSCSTGKL